MPIRINTDGYTVGSRVYRAGQVVEEPGEKLLALARDPHNCHIEEVEDAEPALPITVGAGRDLETSFTAEALSDMARDELRDLAKERGVEVAGNASKAAFIDAILVAQQSKGGEA